jgi:hypothetical protein
LLGLRLEGGGFLRALFLGRQFLDLFLGLGAAIACTLGGGGG